MKEHDQGNPGVGVRADKVKNESDLENKNKGRGWGEKGDKKSDVMVGFHRGAQRKVTGARGKKGLQKGFWEKDRTRPE